MTSRPDTAILPEFRIRKYRDSDWLRLCEIHDRARRDELRLAGCDAAFLTLEQTAHAEGLFDNQLDVLLSGSVICAFVAYSTKELNWLYVDPDHYRRGVGREMVRHVVANSGPSLIVEVLEGNEPAIALYMTEGFRVLNTKTGRLTGNETFAVRGLILKRFN